jgi:hypothetical protein
MSQEMSRVRAIGELFLLIRDACPNGREKAAIEKW